jgi:4-alpha-glucanotransferase
VGGASALRTVIDAHNLRQELAELEWLELIDWPRAGRARITLLRALFDWSSADSQLTRELSAFRCEQGEALERHARFEALQVHFRAHGTPGGWQAWPAEYHDPASPAVAAFAREHSRDVAFHAFLQWLAARGLEDAQRTARASGMAIGLIADLAVGTDAGGSQAWSHQGELLHGLSVGAPPDLLNRHGQDWGLTTFSPMGLRQSGYAGYLAMLRSALTHAGGVRIDHALGLKRLWLVPHGFGATEGAYVRYPLGDMLRLLAIESHRNRALVIGEDLGTVPADFRQRIADTGVLGIRVLWFERAADHGFIAPMHWSPEAMATTSTHDVPTVAGWWSGRDVEWRARAGLAEPGVDEIAERAIDRARLWRALCASGAAPAGGRAARGRGRGRPRGARAGAAGGGAGRRPAGAPRTTQPARSHRCAASELAPPAPRKRRHAVRRPGSPGLLPCGGGGAQRAMSGILRALASPLPLQGRRLRVAWASGSPRLP